MAKKKARKRTVKRVRRTRRKAPSVSARGSLGGAISGLQAYHKRLVGERALIDEKICAIESALGAMGSAAAQPGSGRPGRAAAGRGARAGSLKAYVGRVLAGRGVMAVKDITEGVRKAGYKTRNKTLSKSVGIALTQMKDVRKVGRGRFKLK